MIATSHAAFRTPATGYGSTSGSAPASGDTVAIAVLSWAWAAAAVEPTAGSSGRWLASHPADATLAANLATTLPATCRF